MDRKEFCNMLLEIRETNGINRHLLSLKTEVEYKTLRGIETAKHSSGMDKIINYLAGLDKVIFLDGTPITNYQQMIRYIKKVKKERDITPKKLCAKMGVTSQYIRMFENEISILGLDKFLKFIDVFNINLEIKEL